MQRSLLVLALLLVPAIAAAQDPNAPPPERHGLFGGVGLHGGHISCDGPDCDGFGKAGGGSGHIGWVLNDKMAVLLDVWAMTSSRDNVDVTFFAGTINFRYWLAPVLWVQAGLGNGHAQVRVLGGLFQARGDDVPVGEIAAGLEVVRGKSWALDVQVRAAQGTTTEADERGNTTGRMVGLGAAFTFFSSR